MNDFARLQSDFQRAIVDGDDTVLAEILDSDKEKRTVLLGVYRHAYASRLIEVLQSNHELLHTYLGDEVFEEMGQAYVVARPSRNPNLRWFSQGLPAFLAETEPYRDHPEIVELAVLEKALNDAFDSPDAPALAVTDLAEVPPEAWNGITFTPHTSARRFDFKSNAAGLWTALRAEEAVPEPEELAEPARILVWRQEFMPMFRELSTEEAMMWDEAANGIPFGVLCAMLATYDDPDNAAARAAGYLHGWIGGGLLTAVSIAKSHDAEGHG